VASTFRFVSVELPSCCGMGLKTTFLQPEESISSDGNVVREEEEPEQVEPEQVLPELPVEAEDGWGAGRLRFTPRGGGWVGGDVVGVVGSGGGDGRGIGGGGNGNRGKPL